MNEKNSKPTIQIPLTPAQQEQIRKATGKQVASLKLEPIENRLAPGRELN
jgi:hypothetical protein